MFAYLVGSPVEVNENTLVLEVNQVGYLLSVSSRDAADIPSSREKIKVYTYLSVREDAVSLFGFLSKDDLEVFRLLLTVNGIGPKAALGVLSVFSADDIRFAVLSDDARTLAKAPGIGAKTAKKMILELKDRMSLEDAFEKKLENLQEDELRQAEDAKSEAVQALTALGYSNSDALRAVRKVSVTEEMDTEEILKLALKHLL